VIITGANCGIGKETAKFIAKKGAKIIMACRNMQTAAEARGKVNFWGL
jgi:NADP-dependent 3-hydroxy acid dehydrogenase YdfG